jgi:hypothetical protein
VGGRGHQQRHTRNHLEHAFHLDRNSPHGTHRQGANRVAIKRRSRLVPAKAPC